MAKEDTMDSSEMNSMQWASVDVGNGVRLRYAVGGTGPKNILLIHGYPETAIAWRRIVGPLMESGYRVIAPDFRGAGGSTRPADGYDKAQMARDCFAVLQDAEIKAPTFVVGHDIGMMVAYAFARQFPGSTKALAVLDAPLPGTEVFDHVLLDDKRVWHFHFHQAPDIPEALTAGKEAFYLERFWHDLAYDAGAIDLATKQRYLESFSGPGGMRAGFQLYRAFAQDAAFNRTQLAEHGKTAVPVLAVAGESSAFAPVMERMMKEVAKSVKFVCLARAGHWLAEENPAGLVEALLNFDRAN